ncbi:hypothetical protein K435DRAFT_849432 [Dendrothele bispora CBS 962.96]|uniref:WW domain-containing protein n=1 Tax=Dendrothele bispora (strain CBS 962.96) TaxID=1314807 RepID=A0A4S8MTG9_DENBC|nr:hypothetical protein K435DRAFT_849432 [Dendrothele bispora CBS 962.96]
MSSNHDERPLPKGWVKEWHDSGHPYYIDTQSNPPRSIWIHPLDDEQYIREHPEAREKTKTRPASTKAPPAKSEDKDRRHSFSGTPSTSNATAPRKRGFFGKLKDKAIGTKEEREAEKQRMAMLQEQRRQQRLAQQAAFNQQYGQPQYGYGQPPGQYGHGQPYGAPGPYGQQQFGYGQGGRRPGGGMGGMGGMALPLVGGLAGGLLLGEALDGGFDGGGDFDGGGGDFGDF